MTPEEAEQLQAENAKLIEQINVQAEHWKADQVEKARLNKRVDTLQGMVDWLQANRADLEAQLTDEAIAERVFG